MSGFITPSTPHIGSASRNNLFGFPAFRQIDLNGGERLLDVLHHPSGVFLPLNFDLDELSSLLLYAVSEIFPVL